MKKFITNMKKSKWEYLRYSLYALFLLGEMIVASLLYKLDFSFATAWAAIVATVIGVSSWVQKNKALQINDNERLSDSRKEKRAEIATEILEKTYQVHRAIMSICHPLSSSTEETEAKEYYEIPEEKKTNPHGLIFAHRFNNHINLFSEYNALDIKAKIYFSQSVADKINDIKKVLSFIQREILFANNETFEKKWDDCLQSIWSFFLDEWVDGTIIDNGLAQRTKEQWETFHTMCHDMDEALLSYIRADNTDEI